MIGYLARRTVTSAIVALVVTAVVFAVAPLAQTTDPAMQGMGDIRMSDEDLAQVRHVLGLDQPIEVRYAHWLGGALRGDLGTSLRRNQPVTAAVGTALPVTFSIALIAVFVTLAIALPAGAFAAIHQGGGWDRAVLLASSFAIALPNFVIGLLLAMLLGLYLRLLPTVGFTPITDNPSEWLKHILLPGAALGTPLAAVLTRYVRNAMADVLRRDYIRTAVGKGLPDRSVIWKHALKNALAPAITVLGLEIRNLLGGALAVETVFALPGMGTLTISAILQGDYPVIEGIVLVALMVVVVVNLVVDLSYGYLNPKVRIA